MTGGETLQSRPLCPECPQEACLLASLHFRPKMHFVQTSLYLFSSRSDFKQNPQCLRRNHFTDAQRLGCCHFFEQSFFASNYTYCMSRHKFFICKQLRV